MSKRFFAVLLMVLLLVIAVVPLDISLSASSDGFGSSFEGVRTFYGEFGEVEEERPSFVDGEVLVKFRMGVSEKEIGGLRAAQGCEEVYVSPFSGVRRWRVPPSKIVAEWVDFLGGHPLVEYAEPNFLRFASWVV